ncbi:MAG: NADH-quinone oxidoreductase subunit NuoF [Gammaproteobacteria bacterium]|nr:NADH-quinone oxidoreductase subunit NuoF [Gammaproteobacteria bacterium]
MIKVFVPRDSTALSLGANRTAKAIQAEADKRGVEIVLIRNGSRGLFWLEPFVEVETEQGRVAFAPVKPKDVSSLFDANFTDALSNTAKEHSLYLGLVKELKWLKKQHRLTFARAGISDPVSLDDYIELDGYKGLKNALTMSSEDIVKAVTDSGLRGRGGAAFPTGIKWNTVLGASANQKYIVCNADEGDSGTFSDRMIMENDPFVLIEGMTIAGLAVGATQGYIYLRSEYPHSLAILNETISKAYNAGYLGDDIKGSGKSFYIEVRRAAGAYICGEETALLESLEGKRGLVRFKPPLPAVEGLFAKPTVVNNVISLATVPIILDKGAQYYADYGMGRSRGTLPIQLAGNIKQGGLVELAFGATLRELLYDYGGGSATGRPIKAVQVGGPLGAYLPESQFDTPLDYEAFAKIEAVLGHGGIVAFDDTVDMAKMACYAFEFCAIESCGKCTPCRIGAVRGLEVLHKMTSGQDYEKNLQLVRDLSDTMMSGSLCAMGGMTPYPVLSALNHFPKDFESQHK